MTMSLFDGLAPVPGLCTLLWLAWALFSFGGGTLLSFYLDMHPTWKSLNDLYSSTTFRGVISLPCIAVAVYLGRNKDGANWYEQYRNTAAQRCGMMLFYLILWGSFGHIVQLLSLWYCDICHGFFGKTFYSWAQTLAFYYPSAYWVHVIPACLISLLGPLQLTEKIRKWRSFLAHRWIGRVVLLASFVHQISASYIVISNLCFNRHHLFPTSVVANRVYALAFVPLNMYGMTATIMGYITVRQRQLKEHGAWMYRLAGIWFFTVFGFRVLNGPMVVIFGPEWGVALHVWVAISWTIPLEIYLQKSGRFDWKIGNDLHHRMGKEAACPFLATQPDPRHVAPGVVCPFFAAKPNTPPFHCMVEA